MPRHTLLSDAQRHAIETAHFDLDPRDIARYWTLSAAELLGIQRRRRDSNRFGFAVQLCLLRFPGWPAKKNSPVPVSLLRYVGQQLSIESADIEDYFRRQPTRSDHLQEIIDLYGFRSFTDAARVELQAWLKSQAHRWNTPLGMFMALLDQMRVRRIVIPMLSTIEDLAWRTHRQVEQEALAKLAAGLTPTQRAQIEALLIPAVGDDDRTLTWLRRPLGKPGAAGMIDLLDRLDFVRDHELRPQLAVDVSPLLVRQLASRGARHTLQHLRDYETNKRLGIVASYLLDCQPTLLDEIVELFTRLVGHWFNRADKRRWRSFQDHGRTINEKLHHFLLLGDALVAARKNKTDLEAAVEAALGWDSLSSSLGETKLVAAPLDFSNLEELPSQYSRARQYAPRLMATLDFQATAALQPLIKAVELLRSLNTAHQSAIPADAPRAFVPPRWRPYIFTGDGKIDRAYYELCVLNELNLALRSGDVWIPGSRRFLPLDDYLLPADDWKKLSAPAGQLSCTHYLEQRRQQVHDGLERILPLLAAGQLPEIVLKAGKLSISPLEADVPSDAETWSNRLYDVLPRVPITDLLSEVDSWTGFSQHFLHLYKQEPAEDRAMVLAVILSDATNLGLTKIAEAMPDRSERQLSWVADWYVREENYAKALADLIHKQHQIPLAAQWGTGTTSSSDGQAFPIGARKPVLAHINAKYGRDPVVMIYSHISDRYAPFYTKAIRSNARDAPHVLDGLLDHGTGIKIDEHYTDTGGVTEQVFALCHLLGFRFAPRIRDLPDRRLFTFRPLKQYGILKELAGGIADAELIERNWDEVMRLVESIRMGKVSASLAVSKLAAYPSHNEVARALREVGRIERTVYTLDWLQQPELRRRVQAGLNKGELRNSLARALRFYRRGGVADRDREEQQRKASGLNLVIGAICLWNTVYLQKAVAAMNRAGAAVPEHVLAHISPLGWEHITLTGTYRFRRFVSDFDTLRALRPFRTQPRPDAPAQAG